MSAPTQELPPWLSLTTVALPQTTETSVVFLPLTYYGPSIPLDPDWTYGGLTSPASSTVASTLTSSLSITSTTTTASSSFATPSSSSAVTSSPSAVTPSPSASAIPARPSSALTRGQLIGVIIGAVLGSLVLFLICLSCGVRFCRGRKERDEESQTQRNTASSRTKFTSLLPRRRRRTRTRFSMVTPMPGGDEFDADWLMVQSPSSPQATEPGSGRTEVDPFLTRTSLPNPHPGGSGSAGNNTRADGAVSGSASSRGTGSTGATTSSGTNTSGYGVLLAHPSLGLPERAQDGSNPFDVPATNAGSGNSNNLPPGAAPPTPNGAGVGSGPLVPGRRILSPSQLAMLIEEEDVHLPRPSVEGSHVSMDREEGEVVVARRVTVSPTSSSAAGPSNREKRRSWIPRFSWLNRDSRSSRDIEEEGGLLFDAGGHSPSNSISSPGSPLPEIPPPPLVGPAPRAPSPRAMGEFGTRPLLPFLASRLSPPSSRPVSGVGVIGSRPNSGVSGMSSDGTTGSAKSGGTVYTDARETLSTRGSNPRVGNGTPAGNENTQEQAFEADPLDLPAPVAFAPFASSSQASLHHTASRPSLRQSLSDHSLHASTSASASLSFQNTTLTGTPSAATLATFGTASSPLKSDYAHPPPGLGHDALSRDAQSPIAIPPSLVKTGSIGSWDAAALELGFSRPASHSKLGTFGSANREAPAVFGAIPPPVPAFGVGDIGTGAPGIRIVGATSLAARNERSSAPRLSLDLSDAPPGAHGQWRLLGGSTHSLLGGSNAEWGLVVGGESLVGRRDTFGTGAAQYHHTLGFSSEHGSLHSRLNESLGSSSLSSGSRSGSGHAHLPSGAAAHSLNNSSGESHSQYPSSGSARVRTAMRPGSVEGPMSPAVSAFGHVADHSGSSGSSGRREASASSTSPLSRARSPASPLLVPWAGGLDADWRPT
ncbi:hypothetical protein GGX14DRAFT_609207 [Mycena pura]|uniref:Uncharacterized protein n=1 Tax=Mycena pura TaxID=153505 RepID=A0AAD6Y107_9AGAR|nr:hypothetical protein GGX14DRAFT_609207 [Mycena pura]